VHIYKYKEDGHGKMVQAGLNCDVQRLCIEDPADQTDVVHVDFQFYHISSMLVMLSLP
jgi:hypothetical protein